MPTGYTYYLIEENLSFKDFTLLCARAMGACITMREEPFSTLLPEKFEPSNYHQEQIEEAIRQQAELTNMSEKEKEAYGVGLKANELKYHKNGIKENMKLNTLLNDMQVKVKQWKAPIDHVGLKDFMTDQLEISKNCGSYHQDAIEEIEKKSGIDFYIEKLKKATKDVVYHNKGHSEELERIEVRNKWLRELRESL